ncbi:MAG TPA: hypothetical protein VF669_14085 [Tepidisphaeraceae bacterium]|jgi:hypothetical protein
MDVLLEHNLEYTRRQQEGAWTRVSVDHAGLLIASGPGGEQRLQLTRDQLRELGEMLQHFHEIVTKPWLRRAWTADPNDISIQFGPRKIHACDLEGRNSLFWRIEHFLEQLLQAPVQK